MLGEYDCATRTELHGQAAATSVRKPAFVTLPVVNPHAQWRPRLSAPGVRHLRGYRRVIEPSGGVLQGGRDVLALQIREVSQDLLRRLSRRQQLQNIDHPHPHSTDAGAATTLVGIDRDPV